MKNNFLKSIGTACFQLTLSVSSLSAIGSPSYYRSRRGSYGNNNIPIFQVSKENLSADLIPWLQELNPDLAICLTFPFKIPENVICTPKKGPLNIHFGPIPTYGGSDPLFWMIKNEERTATITVQQMIETMDSGPVIHREQSAIYPGENYGLLGSRLSQLSANMRGPLLEKLKRNERGTKDLPQYIM
ncbi:formyltransferase family protein [Flammeovirgaceae bacterium SG7u.111]|nr:formyltransferase family protein [Flammeovirgaceae bacterium SG7u.132]WPO36796.1 formyltransferase family protein [Flammeovirgaceae bacterium SG7u.111]